MAARRRTNGTTREQNALLDALRHTGNITAAAEVAGMDRRRHYDWLDTSPKYAAKYAEIVKNAVQVCEQEALHRALVGRKRKKFFRGEPIIDPETGQQYVEEEPSDQLLIFMLKSLAPETYKESVHHTGQVTVDVREVHELINQLAAADRSATEAVISERVTARQSVNGHFRGNGKPR